MLHFRISIALGVVVASTLSGVAQTVNPTPDCVQTATENNAIEIPIEVVITPDGKLLVKTSWVPKDDPAPAQTYRVPVWSILDNGDRVPGVLLTHRYLPNYVYLNEHGSWAITRSHRQWRFPGSSWKSDEYPHLPNWKEQLARDGGTYDNSSWTTVVRYNPFDPARLRHPIRNSTPTPTAQERGGWNLRFFTNPNFPPPNPLPDGFVGSLARVEMRLESLFQPNAGVVDVILEFRNDLPPDAPAGSFAIPQVLSWPFVAITLENQAAADGEPNAESLVYENLPLSAFLPVRAPGGASTSVFDVSVPNAIAQKWGLPDDPGKPDGFIAFNNTTAWDYDSTDGINAGTRDFEKVLLHEMLHVLGFLSVQSLDEGANSLDFVEMTDIFRFAVADVGSSVSAGEMLTDLRGLELGQDAVMATQLSFSSATYPMSVGESPPANDFQADHWKAAPRGSPPNS